MIVQFLHLADVLVQKHLANVNDLPTWRRELLSCPVSGPEVKALVQQRERLLYSEEKGSCTAKRKALVQRRERLLYSEEEGSCTAKRKRKALVQRRERLLYSEEKGSCTAKRKALVQRRERPDNQAVERPGTQRLFLVQHLMMFTICMYVHVKLNSSVLLEFLHSFLSFLRNVYLFFPVRV